MDELAIGEGSVVADLGAGGGWFTVRLAHRVGPNGRVYAEDVQRQMIEATMRRVAREGLSNVIPILGDLSNPHLKEPVDAVSDCRHVQRNGHIGPPCCATSPPR